MRDKKGFDLWAEEYDRTVQISEEKNEYPFAAYKEVLNTVYNIVRGKRGKLLDIGFGTGILTKKLYDDGYDITGIDFSERMIEIAKEKMPDAILLNHDFSYGLPESLCDNKFDWIISTYAIHHLNDGQKKQLIYELIRHLNTGGAIIIGDVAFQNKEEMDKARIKAGDEWDNEEYYIVVDELKKMLPDLIINFEKKSFCSGVLSISKANRKIL